MSNIKENILNLLQTTKDIKSKILDNGGEIYNNSIVSIPNEIETIFNVKMSKNLQWELFEKYRKNLLSEYEGNNNKIANYVFAYCTSLQSVSFPECTNIGAWAFGGCFSLQSVSFPKCTTIGGSAFNNCSSLQSISFPECTTIGGNAFAYCISLQSVSFPKCTTISHYAFQSCISLTSISFPKCTTISYSAFISCTSLQSVVFLKCTLIDRSAFDNCTSLQSIYLLASSICTLSATTAFYNTPISNSTYLGYFGSIYVPASLVSNYKTATNWTQFSNRITSYIE